MTDNTQLTKQAPSGVALGAADYFNSNNVKAKFEKLLGKRATPFITSILQIVTSNSLLAKADLPSIYHAATTAAVLDLPINNNLGFAYIVPFNDKKANKCLAQLQIGYKGYKQLAIRSGQYKELNAKPVYEGQLLEDDSFQGFTFDWSKKVSDKVIGYASNYKLLNGYESTFFMTIADIEKHAKRYSQTYKRGFGLWVDDYDKMALKTVIKLHLNAGDAPLSIEMQTAITHDQAAISEDGSTEYVDHEDVTIKTNQNTINSVEEANKATADALEAKEVRKATRTARKPSDDIADAVVIEPEEPKEPKANLSYEELINSMNPKELVKEAKSKLPFTIEKWGEVGGAKDARTFILLLTANHENELSLEEKIKELGIDAKALFTNSQEEQIAISELIESKGADVDLLAKQLKYSKSETMLERCSIVVIERLLA